MSEPIDRPPAPGFRFETTGTNRDFDCGLLDPVKDLSGIDGISVTRFSMDDRKSPMKEVYGTRWTSHC